jgi:hypothetical protein
MLAAAAVPGGNQDQEVRVAAVMALMIQRKTAGKVYQILVAVVAVHGLTVKIPPTRVGPAVQGL